MMMNYGTTVADVQVGDRLTRDFDGRVVEVVAIEESYGMLAAVTVDVFNGPGRLIGFDRTRRRADSLNYWRKA